MLFGKPVQTVFSKRMALRRLKHIPKKNLTWLQARRRYPKLNPFGDADKDGVMNIFDCKPFNRKRQEDNDDEYTSASGHRVKILYDPMKDPVERAKQEAIDKKEAEREKNQVIEYMSRSDY